MFNEWEECDSVGFTFSVLSGCHGKTKRAVLATFLHFLCQQIIAVLFQTDVPLSLVTWPTPPGGNMEMFLKIERDVGVRAVNPNLEKQEERCIVRQL